MGWRCKCWCGIRLLVNRSSGSPFLHFFYQIMAVFCKTGNSSGNAGISRTFFGVVVMEMVPWLRWSLERGLVLRGLVLWVVLLPLQPKRQSVKRQHKEKWHPVPQPLQKTAAGNSPLTHYRVSHPPSQIVLPCLLLKSLLQPPISPSLQKRMLLADTPLNLNRGEWGRERENLSGWVMVFV